MIEKRAYFPKLKKKKRGNDVVATVRAGGLSGLDGYAIEVETDVSRSADETKIDIVGLPDNAVREAKERLRAALKNSGYGIEGFCVTINLAPADVKKEGSVYDLAMILGVLTSAEVFPPSARKNVLSARFLFRAMSDRAPACLPAP